MPEGKPKQHSVKWDQRLIELAAFIAQWPKYPSTTVGAVTVDPRNSLYRRQCFSKLVKRLIFLIRRSGSLRVGALASLC